MESKILSTYHNPELVLNGDIDRGCNLYRALLENEQEHFIFQRWLSDKQVYDTATIGQKNCKPYMNFAEYKNTLLGIKPEKSYFDEEEKQRLLNKSKMIRETLKVGD